MRGSDGVPITSGKLCHPGSWEDCQVGIDHIAEKYARDPKTREKRCQIYAYGCSMGASVLGVYLIEASEQADDKKSCRTSHWQLSWASPRKSSDVTTKNLAAQAIGN